MVDKEQFYDLESMKMILYWCFYQQQECIQGMIKKVGTRNTVTPCMSVTALHAC